MPNNHQNENTSSMPNFPILENQRSTSTVSQNMFPTDSDALNQTSTQFIVSRYMLDTYYNNLILRIEPIEKRLADVEKALERDRSFERAARRSLSIGTFCGILMPALSLLLLACIFCFKAPQEFFTIVSEYAAHLTIGGCAILFGMAYPLWSTHEYNKRLDKIEKVLHLNGND